MKRLSQLACGTHGNGLGLISKPIPSYINTGR